MAGIQQLGRLLRKVRAVEGRSVWNRPELAAPDALRLSSPAFAEGGRMPASSAGPGMGANLSPALEWNSVPLGARTLLLVIEDLDAPKRTPLVHTLAILDAATDGLAEGDLAPSNTSIRFVRTALGPGGYHGPQPIPGHGPHHYGFYLFALDVRIPDAARTTREVLAAAGSHVLARGRTLGTFERS